MCLTTKGASNIWYESSSLKLLLGDENKILTTFADSLDVGATNLNGQVHWVQYFRKPSGEHLFAYLPAPAEESVPGMD